MTKPQVYPSAHPRELIDICIEWIELGHRIAMLTLVDIEGNAPYPTGSQMLVRDDGEFSGQITGGCAETALVQQALVAIASNKNVTQRYGLNSPYFDIQLPCGSGLDIEFDVNRDLVYYQTVANQLSARQKFIANPTKTYYPSPRFLLFGQGPIVGSLVKLATESGFDVMVFDHHEAYCIKDYCDEYCALVSLFHEHELEFDILHTALNSNVFYIGALGSKRTHQARLKTLLDQGLAPESCERIHGPVGVNIHAKTPAQIAVSILAQVILVMNGHIE